MNKQTRLQPSGSIVERAAEAFDFSAEFQRPPHAPHRVEAPAPEPLVAVDVDETLVVPVAAPERPFRSEHPGRTAAVNRTLMLKHGFVEPDGPVTGLAEEFRIIKRRLLLGATGQSGIEEEKRQTILVCSAQPEEGKTFCAVNLALSIAVEKDLEVLLIDGDFANSKIPARLGIRAEAGFSDALADAECDVNSLIIQTDIGGLSVLPSGKRANDITELLTSARTREVLRALTRDHPRRILIFDSPPALVASPACVLASHAGQIMMVVRADRTTESDLREALSLLSACDTISLMLNRASLAASGRRFGSYYGQEQ